MLRLSLTATFLLTFTSTLRAESLPSFHLPWAARSASEVVVVEDGKVAEVWAGDAKVGEPFASDVKPVAVEVKYGYFGDSPQFDKLIDEDLAKKGFKRVPQVSGKRIVHFVLREPHEGIAQMLCKSSDFTTAWLEDGQAFAIQQWMNPGPSEMRALEMTEAQLKQAVLDLRAVHEKLKVVNEEKDRAVRCQLLLDLLRPDNRWWNGEVDESLRLCGPASFPVLAAALENPQYAASHLDLIYTIQVISGRRAVPIYEKILAKETEYFRKLDDAGQKYDRKSPEHWPHELLRLRAQWGIDYNK